MTDRPHPPTSNACQIESWLIQLSAAQAIALAAFEPLGPVQPIMLVYDVPPLDPRIYRGGRGNRPYPVDLRTWAHSAATTLPR